MFINSFKKITILKFFKLNQFNFVISKFQKIENIMKYKKLRFKK